MKMEFECALIDGNHWGNNCYLDFVEIEHLVKKQILIDDYNHDEGHTVMENVDRILKNYKNWHTASVLEGHHILLERIA